MQPRIIRFNLKRESLARLLNDRGRNLLRFIRHSSPLDIQKAIISLRHKQTRLHIFRRSISSYIHWRQISLINVTFRNISIHSIRHGLFPLNDLQIGGFGPIYHYLRNHTSIGDDSGRIVVKDRVLGQFIDFAHLLESGVALVHYCVCLAI
jgi:hypothetical protein